jgi:alkylation response protein AidB-like acyl-CoA dehydrogenase
VTGFRAPVEDILHSLQCVAGHTRMAGWDAELAGEVVHQFARFAEADLAPLNASGDEQGCRLADGRVVTPDGFRAAYTEYAGQGLPGLTLPVAHGGQDMPLCLQGAVTEIFAGANHALQMLCGLATGAAHAIAAHGTPQQVATWLPRLASGAWLATMCMSEAGAGSDLAQIRTSARREGDHWRLDGEKIFISGGDHDLGEGILHLVLARSGERSSGTRGLSLFLCPSQDEQGRRNPVRVMRIEDKLGLHASPTCQLLFDAAPAQLLGEEGQGLRAMFVMMNPARIDVGLQGVAQAARAAALAGSYAATRVQGGVVLEQHADVRRMLDEQRALALPARLLCQLALGLVDSMDPSALLDFLTPICKTLGSNAGIRAADLGIQVLGGYGYLREYGLEQCWRDARITAIYEGTNGIQAATLAGRLLRHNEGEAAEDFAGWINYVAGLAEPARGKQIRDAAQLWSLARSRVAQMPDPGPVAQLFMDLSGSVAQLAAWEVLTGKAAPAGAAAGLGELADVQFSQLSLRIAWLVAQIN